MNKLKLMTIVGTRPEIIRLSATIKACDQYFDHILVHTGQNYDYTLNQIFFEDLELREPDYYLAAVGEHLGATMGDIIAKSYEVLVKEQPDALLVLGDTNSCLSAIAAKRLKIPIFHMEAGNRCFDQNVPEEINRKIVDHISDVNLPYTEHSRRFLLDEGLRKEHIFVTGTPMREVIMNHLDKIKQSSVLEKLHLQPKRYILVSAHREENIDHEANFNALMTAINQIAEHYQLPVIYSTHPRSWKQIEQRQFKFHPLVQQLKPFGFIDYNALQRQAYVVLSDSGTLSEESSILKFPAILLRDSTEHAEVVDKGTIILGGNHASNIIQSIEVVKQMEVDQAPMIEPYDYQDSNVSLKVVKIIQGYKDIINHNIWRK